MSRDDVDRFGIHVPKRRSETPRRQFDDMLVGLVVAVEVAQGSFDAVAFARPGANFHCSHVLNEYATHERSALPAAPLLIHIHAHERGLLFRIELDVVIVHDDTSV
jgi:hypothetical protein